MQIVEKYFLTKTNKLKKLLSFIVLGLMVIIPLSNCSDGSCKGFDAKYDECVKFARSKCQFNYGVIECDQWDNYHFDCMDCLCDENCEYYK